MNTLYENCSKLFSFVRRTIVGIHTIKRHVVTIWFVLICQLSPCSVDFFSASPRYVPAKVPDGRVMNFKGIISHDIKCITVSLDKRIKTWSKGLDKFCYRIVSLVSRVSGEREPVGDPCKAETDQECVEKYSVFFDHWFFLMMLFVGGVWPVILGMFFYKERIGDKSAVRSTVHLNCSD